MTIIRRDSAAVNAALAADLSQRRAACIDQVNAAIASVRRRYITDLPGQETLYARKLAEAEAVLAAAAQGTALPPSPLLGADVAVGNAEDIRQAAVIVTYLADLWTEVAATLEVMRFAAGNAIQAADAASLADLTDHWVARILAFKGAAE